MHIFHFLLRLHQLLVRRLDLHLVLLLGSVERLLQFVDVVELLLAHVHFLVGGGEDFVHFVLLPVDLL